MNVNKLILAGRLTRDVELRNTQSGQAVGKFGLAINRKWTSDGEQKESACFVDCVAWGKSAERLAHYVKKGSELYIEGRLEFSQWEDQQGQKRSKLEAVVEHWQFVGPKQDETRAPARAPAEEREPDYGDIPF